MINGAHIIIHSRDAEADRGFLKDVLGFKSVDVGDGWLIFALPESEVAVHPAQASGGHELYLMSSDVEAEIARLKVRNIACDPIEDMGWGRLTRIALPGGGKLGLYQPRHARP